MRWFFCLFLLCCSGCSLSGTETLESQLRLREDRIRSLEAALNEADHNAAVARREASRLRATLADPDAVPREEQIASGLAVEQLKFHSLLTGITDNDELHIVLRPVDRDLDLVKLPGGLRIRLTALSAEGSPRTIGSWTWTADEARELWSSAAIGAGYVIDLPLKSPVSDSELELHAVFEPADGRQFEASYRFAVE